MLGAGAAASSALSALSGIAKGEVEIYIRNRARDAEVHAIAEAVGTSVRIRDWAEAAAAFEGDLVISTTPVGATDDFAAAVPGHPGDAVRRAVPPVADAAAAAWAGRAARSSADSTCWCTKRCCRWSS